MNPRIATAGVAAALAVAAGGGWIWWKTQAVPPAVAEAAAPAPPAASAAPAAAASAVVRHPIETLPRVPVVPADAPASDSAIFGEAVTALLGREATLALLQTDGLVARIVATVDNLDREHAPSRLWPVNPVAGRFATVGTADGLSVAPSNGARYERLVAFFEGIDTPRAVALYVRFYPQFQRSYMALGYPQRYFNDRLVDVIDHLLAAPTPPAPVAVNPVEVKGPYVMAQPWVHHAFADPALEATTAGRKILARIGSDRALRLKAKLAEFRRAIATAPAAR
jgi:hypothetical protein